MADEHKSRLSGLTGLITAIAGLIAAVASIMAATKTGVFAPATNAAATVAVANESAGAGHNVSAAVVPSRAAAPVRSGTAVAAPSGGGGGSAGAVEEATETSSHKTADHPEVPEHHDATPADGGDDE